MNTAPLRPGAPDAGPAPGCVRRGVAVIVSRFPKITETFILREIGEMERQGQPVLLVPILREPAGVAHAEVWPWLRRALFTPLLSPQAAAAMARAAHRDARGLLRLVGLLTRATAADPAMLLRTLALLPKSLDLAERLQAQGIRHIHAHFATHPTTVALIINRLTGIDFSFTAHAHDIFVSRALLREKIRRAAFVRVISDFNADYLTARYPAECAGKLRVIHVGVDASAYVRPARIRTGPLILCVAALRPYKGVDVLIEAMARLRAEGIDVRCDIIGEGPLRAALERRVEQLGLGDRVRLIGALPQEQVRQRLSRATLFVLPSVVQRDGQMEGIPVALMEAMAAWLPVVASRLSGIPELVQDDDTGLLVPPGDAAAIARAVRRLLENPASARQLAARGARRVQREFSLVGTTAELVAQLDRVNPPVGAELERLIRESGWEGFRGATVGLSRAHERRDSCVLEVLAADARGARRLVLKTQRSRTGESYPAPARARAEYTLLSRFRTERTPAWPTCAVPQVLHLQSASATVLMEECRGESLDSLIRAGRAAPDPRRRAALLEAVRGAGVWLRAFHGQNGVHRPAGPYLDAVLGRIERDLRACEERGVLSRRRARAVQARVDTLRWQLSASDLLVVGIHGDFWPGNIFVCEEAVEVIDFEGYRFGLPAEDAGYFMAHLAACFARPGLRARLEPVAAAFLEGHRSPAEQAGGDAAVRLGEIAALLGLLVRSAGPRPSVFEAVAPLLMRAALRNHLAQR